MTGRFGPERKIPNLQSMNGLDIRREVIHDTVDSGTFLGHRELDRYGTCQTKGFKTKCRNL